MNAGHPLVMAHGGPLLIAQAQNRLFLRGLMGTAIAALAVNRIAYAVPGIGIAVPTLIPPLIAAMVAWLLGRIFSQG